jgi:hypothetical protein
MWKRLSPAAAAFLLAVAAHAAVPMEHDAFTSYALDRLKQIKPDVDAQVSGPGAITVKGGGTMYLDRIYDYCQRNADGCAAMLDNFLTSMLTVRTDVHVPFDVAMLRAALRPNAYVAGITAQLGDKPETRILARPFAGDLTEVCLLDSPQTASLVKLADLEKAQLTPDAAFKACEENLVKAVPFPDTSDVASGRAKPFVGDFYESSLPLLHDAWAPVAQRFGGKLLIAIPEVRVVIVANGDNPSLARALSNAAAVGAQGADRPLSTQVFRWTPTGWEAVAPDSI